MDNCWFVLRQTHYTPPDMDSMRKGEPTGPISLGHIIPDLMHLDQVINAEAIEPFSRAMQIWPTRLLEFKWDHTKGRETAVSGSAWAPIAAGTVLTVNADVGVAFRRSVKNYWKFEHLDRYIVQPTSFYVNRCLESEEVVKHIEKVKTLGFWSIFMITGLTVARGSSKNTTTESHGNEIHGKFNVLLPTVVDARSGAKDSNPEDLKVEATHAKDFVWAIRLAKISMNGLRSNWSMDTVFGRASFGGPKAVFADGRDEIDVGAVVAAEGLGKFQVIEDRSLECAFVLFDLDTTDSSQDGEENERVRGKRERVTPYP